MRWGDVLTDLVKGTELTSDQVAWAMGQILAGDATPVQIAGFAVALRAKGETHPIETTGRELRKMFAWQKSADTDYVDGSAGR